MRILHTGDIHLGDLAGPVRDGRNARREDTLRCMRAIAEAAKVEQPNVSIIAGDLFNRSRVWADTALDDIDAAVSTLIRPLCRESEKVVLLFGTMNHDNPKAFNVLRNLTQGIHNLTIYTTPEVDRLNTSAGEIPLDTMLDVKCVMEEIDDLSQDFSFCRPYRAPERTRSLIREFLDSTQLSVVKNASAV